MASFKYATSLKVAEKQNHIYQQTQMVNLLAASNRYGYIFYATEDHGLAIISSMFIDRQSRHLSKVSDDDDDDADNENQNSDRNTFIYRSYIPGQGSDRHHGRLMPCWMSINADDSILALVLLQLDTRLWQLIFYDVVQLIQGVIFSFVL